MKSLSSVFQGSSRYGVSLLAEVATEVQRSDLVTALQLFQDRLHHALADLPSTRGKRADDVIARETKFLQSSLSSFLTTPLRSDAAEVSRIFGESLRRAVDDGGTDAPLRLIAAKTGIVAPPAGLSEAMQLLVDEGMRYLHRLISHGSQPEAALLETTVCLDGAAAPALVADLVQYAASGLQGISPGVIAVGSVAATSEHPVPKAGPGGGYACTVLLISPRSASSSFVARVLETLRGVEEEEGVERSSVWLMQPPYSSTDELYVRVFWKTEAAAVAGAARLSAQLDPAPHGAGISVVRGAWFTSIAE